MKWFTPGAIALLAGAALFAQASRRSATPAAVEPGEAVAWADPAAAEVSRDLDVQQAEALRRSEVKTTLTASLLRGEVTLEQAADRFRAVNSGGVRPYGRLSDLYPGVTEEELSYRQVILFVRGMTRVIPDAVAERLPALEAEVARRFPADSSKAPVLVW